MEISNHIMPRKNSDLTNKYLSNLHQGAMPSTHRNANKLRRRQTEAEQKLWSLLRNRQLKGKKFRRQHAITGYVADFYCHEAKLAIELDGNYHTTVEAGEYDASRTALLNECGITVLRFWNQEVINDPAKALQKISDHLINS